MADSKSRETFGTRVGFVLAAAGSAVGLGNLWKFPYVAGQNGGAAFVFIYIVMIILVGASAMLGEVLIGRLAGLNAPDAFEKLGGKRWKLTGYIGTLCCTVILSYYSVVGGWIIKYFLLACTSLIPEAGAGNAGAVFGAFVSSPLQVIFFQGVFMLATALVVILGVKAGIERCCKVMMPLLFIAMLVLIVRAVTLPGAASGLNYYLNPDFSKVTAGTFLAALGQGFFSLSVGAGCMLIYGSYLDKNTNMMTSVAQICFIDTLVAFLAGIMIFPAVFALGGEPGAGPGLTFVTLPALFAKLAGGAFFAALFFLLFFAAAITSSISLLEVSVGYLVDRGMGRKRAAAVMSAGIYLLGMLSSYSLTGRLNIGSRSFLDAMSYLTDSILLPIGAFFTCIFVGWIMNKRTVWNEVTNEGKLKFPSYPVWMFLIGFVVPSAVAIIFFTGIKW